MALERFPQIKSLAEKIGEKAYKDPYLCYEESLVKQIGFLLRKKVVLKTVEKSLSDGFVSFLEPLDLLVVGVCIELTEERRSFVIRHEVGHLIIAHYNLLHLKDENFTFKARGETLFFKNDRWGFLMNRLINPENGKEFGYRWYRRWNKRSWIGSEFYGRYCVVEKLCNEISEYLGEQYRELKIIDQRKQFLLPLVF